MDYRELIEKCNIERVSPERLKSCVPFVCSEKDINDFFANDVHGYQTRKLTKAYIVTAKENPNDIIVAYTISNDSIRLTNKFLVEDERLEAKYVGVGVGNLPLNTRLMYFDMLSLAD